MQVLKAKDLIPKNLTVMLYSRPGIGKTTALGQLPGKTLIIDVDRGCTVLSGLKNVDIIQMDAELNTMTDALEMLFNKCEYDNVCIDTLTEFERTMLAKKGRAGKNGGAPEMLHYQQVNFSIVDLCRKLRTLPANIIFTAWLQYNDVVNIDGSKYSQAQPMFSGKTPDQICGLCDIIGELVMNPKDEERFVVFKAGPERLARDRIWKREYCAPGELLNPKKEAKANV